jgi:hypothetical protein
MRRRFLFLLTVVLLGGPARAQTGSEKTYLFTSEPSFSAETGYRRTTGIWGNLTGHWSQADEIAVKEGAQRDLVRDLGRAGVDIRKVTFLPVEITEASVQPVDSWDRTKNTMFGRRVIDVYSKFKASGRVRLSFLHRGNLDLSGMEKHEVTGASLELAESHGRARRTVAEVKVPLSRLALSAYTSETAGVLGRVDPRRVAPESYRYTLADRVKDRKALAGKDLAAVVNLKLGGGMGTQSVTIKRTELPSERSDLLRAMKVKGVGRFFSRGYYRHKLGKVLGR